MCAWNEGSEGVFIGGDDLRGWRSSIASKEHLPSPHAIYPLMAVFTSRIVSNCHSKWITSSRSNLGRLGSVVGRPNQGVSQPLAGSSGPHISLVDSYVGPYGGDIYFGPNSDIEFGLLGLLMDLYATGRLSTDCSTFFCFFLIASPAYTLVA